MTAGDDLVAQVEDGALDADRLRRFVDLLQEVTRLIAEMMHKAEAFAAGRLAGQFPPELLGDLMPRFPRGLFFTVSTVSGEVSSGYWPGFSLAPSRSFLF